MIQCKVAPTGTFCAASEKLKSVAAAKNVTLPSSPSMGQMATKAKPRHCPETLSIWMRLEKYGGGDWSTSRGPCGGGRTFGHDGVHGHICATKKLLITPHHAFTYLTVP
jgi:hypothetical protein